MSKEIKYIPCPECEGVGHIYFDENEFITQKVYQGLLDYQKTYFYEFECEICESEKEIDENADYYYFDHNKNIVIRNLSDPRLDYLKSNISNGLNDLEKFEKKSA